MPLCAFEHKQVCNKIEHSCLANRAYLNTSNVNSAASRFIARHRDKAARISKPMHNCKLKYRVTIQLVQNLLLTLI